MDTDMDAAIKDIIALIMESRPRTKDQLNAAKITMCKKHALARVPTNAEILARAPEAIQAILRPLLQRRKTRTLSGVSVIAVMTKPMDCPGACLYCPGKASQPGDPVAQSYTGKEPAALRSLMHGYDPYMQVSSRIDDLEAIGHRCDKIELIVMGGTFLAAPVDYQESFIQGCLEGITGARHSSLKIAKHAAESSARRLVGVTFETRPDYCTPAHVDAMLHYGGTRVEIGVQTVYNDVLELVHRGHDARATASAIQVAKDAGFKVCAHVMPNLPGSSVDRDQTAFEILFKDDTFKPDYLKIYPCLVIGGTGLESWWRDGRYKPYPDRELVTMLARVKSQILPPWVRVQRVQRDIPAYLILDGVRNSNFREIIWEYMQEHGLRCKCIRCNEYGFAKGKFMKDVVPAIESLDFQSEFYTASGGRECFIKAMHLDSDTIVGYVRLRKPSSLAHRPEFLEQPTSIIRELRVVGEVVPVRETASQNQAQHRGLGRRLVHLAETVAAREFQSEKLLVIAGLGVRSYFRLLGYQPDGPYMAKKVRE